MAPGVRLAAGHCMARLEILSHTTGYLDTSQRSRGITAGNYGAAFAINCIENGRPNLRWLLRLIALNSLAALLRRARIFLERGRILMKTKSKVYLIRGMGQVLNVGGGSYEIKQHRNELIVQSKDSVGSAWREVGQLIGDALQNARIRSGRSRIAKQS